MIVFQNVLALLFMNDLKNKRGNIFFENKIKIKPIYFILDHIMYGFSFLLRVKADKKNNQEKLLFLINNVIPFNDVIFDKLSDSSKF